MAAKTYDPATLTITIKPRQVVEVMPSGKVLVEPVYGPAPWPAHVIGVDFGYKSYAVVFEYSVPVAAFERRSPALPKGER